MSTATIIKELEALNAAGIASRPGSREAMLITARRLVASLQTPSDFISHTLWAEVCLFLLGIQPPPSLLTYDDSRPSQHACVQQSTLVFSKRLRKAVKLRRLFSISLRQQRSSLLCWVSLEQAVSAAECSWCTHHYSARMLRHLGTFGVVHEATEGEWSSTALSRSFTEPKYRDGIIYWYVEVPARK